MVLWWLLIIYILLLAVNAVQLYLAYSTNCLPQAEVNTLRLIRFREAGLPLCYWLARESKDWFAAGLIGGIGILLLRGVFWSLTLWLAGIMAAVLMLRASLALVLVLYALNEFGFPLWLQGWAIKAALPDTMVCSRWRAACWSSLFTMVGFAGLWTWSDAGGTERLLIAFVALVFGFLSLLKTIMPEPGDKGGFWKASRN